MKEINMSAAPPTPAEQFEKCGYAVVKQLLDPQDELNALRAEYGTLLDTLARR